MTSTLRLAPLMMLLTAVPGAAQASPQSVPTSPPPAASYQVVRLGDGQMGCAALVAEISAITAEMDGVQREMMTRAMGMSREATGSLGGGAAGTAMSLGGMAASFIPGADMLFGAAASAAASAQLERQRGRMMEEAEEMAGEALVIGPMGQRLEHLAELSRDRGC